MIADGNHVHLDLDTEAGATERKSTSPLSGSGLCRYTVYSFLFIVVSLSNGSIGLMASRLAGSLIFVENFGGRIQSFLQLVRAE